MTKTFYLAGFVMLFAAISPLSAQEGFAVARAAEGAFDRMPAVEVVDTMRGNCGADGSVHDTVAYCTSRNVILHADTGVGDGVRDYFLAHAYGHAVQVQHGVADVALRAIRSRPDDEAMLRGFVERQVDCIAGFILRRANSDLPDLVALFDADPLDVPNWGRDPLRRGPHLDVPVNERAAWLAQGYDQGLAACAVGEFPPDLLIAARRR